MSEMVGVEWNIESNLCSGFVLQNEDGVHPNLQAVPFHSYSHRALVCQLKLAQVDFSSNSIGSIEIVALHDTIARPIRADHAHGTGRADLADSVRPQLCKFK